MTTKTSLKSTLLAVFITLTLLATAQNKSLQKANALYDSKSYAEAIVKYESVLKKDNSNAEALKKIADCYRLNNNTVQSESYYAQLVTLKKASADEMMYYAQALMSNGKYSKAKEVLSSSQLSGDSRTAEYLKALDNLNRYYKDSSAVKVKRESELNSDENDFCPVLLNGDVIFTSTRKRTEWVRKEHSWSDKVYNLIYIAKKQGNAYAKPYEFGKEYSSNYNDGPLCFSGDAKTMMFTANSMAQNKKRVNNELVRLQLFTCRFDADQNQYEGLEDFAYNSDAYNCAHPALSADGNTLVFASDMPGTYGGMDLWMCMLESGKWSKPMNLGEKINTKGNELFPTLSEGMLYFSSNGRDGLGGLDLYQASGTFGKWNGALNLNAPFNSAADDFGITLEKGGKSGFFSSNRNSKNGDDDIYSFVRSNQVLKKQYTINVLDESSKAKLAADLQLKDTKTGELISQKNEQGSFTIELFPGTEFELLAKADKHVDKTEKYTAASESTDILLKALDKNCINGIVLDKSNNSLPAEEAKVIIKDNSGAKVFETTTGKDGKYSKCDLDKEKTYTVTTSKKGGYFTKTEGLKVPTTEVKTTELEKIVVGKAIKIDNIYFDLGKSTIRTDAANELDKTVQLLRDNPEIIVELSSHTDCRGSASSNLALSDARAKSSVAYIISKGIDKNRITGKGYGESKLANSCACEGAVKSSCSELEHQQNRRTEFKVTGFAK